MGRWAAVLAMILLVGCGDAPLPLPTAPRAPTATPSALSPISVSSATVAAPERATVTVRASATPRPPATERPTATPRPAPTEDTVKQATIEKVATCMGRNFSDASWIGFILQYRLAGKKMDVETTLVGKESNKPTATDLRSGVVACTDGTPIDWVAVHGGNGVVLATGAIPGR